MRKLAGRVLDALSSIWLSCVLLSLLGLLTWLGTLEQVHMGLYEVQKKYFESFVLLQDVGPVRVPLPGANLVMTTLFANLLIGGILRLRRGRATLGILTTHLGIGFLLIAGFVKMYHSEDGHVSLFESEQSSFFQSYYRWEIALMHPGEEGGLAEYVVPQERFRDALGPQPATLTSPELPFDLEVSHFMGNCRPMPKGPMFEVAVPVVDGVFLKSSPILAQTEANVAGAYVTVVEKASDARHQGILWGLDTQPWTVEVEGRPWLVDLRKERYPMPFTIGLEKFTKEDHPGTAMPRMFASDVRVLEGGSSRHVRISMNEPLRAGGLVLYQASWGPSNARPGDPLFSTLSVVRNPADQYPLYACIVIAVGLVLHFSRKLTRYIRSEPYAS